MSTFQAAVLFMLALGAGAGVWILNAIRAELVKLAARSAAQEPIQAILELKDLVCELVPLAKLAKLRKPMLAYYENAAPLLTKIGESVAVLHGDLEKSKFLETVPRVLDRAQTVSELTEKLANDMAAIARGAVMSHDVIVSQEKTIAEMKAKNEEYQRRLGIVTTSGEAKVSATEQSPVATPLAVTSPAPAGFNGGGAVATALAPDLAANARAATAFVDDALGQAFAGVKDAARIEGRVLMGDDGGRAPAGFFPPMPRPRLGGGAPAEDPRDITLGARSGRDGTEG